MTPIHSHSLAILHPRSVILEMLELTSSYPSLPKLDTWNILVQIYVKENPTTTWTVYSAGDAKYRVRRLTYDQASSVRDSDFEPPIYAADGVFPADPFQRHLDEIPQLNYLTRHPAPPSLLLPIQGLIFVSPTFRTEVSWAGEGPDHLQPLVSWFGELLKLIDSHLPAYTVSSGTSVTFDVRRRSTPRCSNTDHPGSAAPALRDPCPSPSSQSALSCLSRGVASGLSLSSIFAENLKRPVNS